MSLISCESGLIEQRDQRRGRRVGLLLVAVVLMSAGDLYATVTHLNSIGMIEVNPIARHVISMGSTAALVIYKLITAGMPVVVLMLLRRHRCVEVGTWIIMAMMSSVTIFWYVYNDYLSDELMNVSYLDAKMVMERLAGVN